MQADAAIFHHEQEAYEYVERHVWPAGPECPRCQSSHRIGRMTGASTRVGTYKCYQCRKPFTVKIGTVFERSHLPLHVWLKAIFLVSTSREDVGAREFQNMFEIAPRSAAAMLERLAVLQLDAG